MVNLPSRNGEKGLPAEELSAAELSRQTEAGGSGREVQGAPAAQEVQGTQATQGEQVAQVIQKKQGVPAELAQQLQGAPAAQGPQVATVTQRNPQGAPEVPLVPGAEAAQRVHKAHENGVLPQDRLISGQLPERHHSEERRRSFPGSEQPRKEEHPLMKCTISVPPDAKRKFKQGNG